MKKILIVIILLISSDTYLYSADEDNVSIYVFVGDINEIAAIGSTVDLEIPVSATTDEITNSTTYYSLTTNAPSTAPVKITANLDDTLPTNLGATLELHLTALAIGGQGGTSTGQTNINTTTPTPIVTGIYKSAITGGVGTTTLSYKFTAPSAAEAFEFIRFATLTLTST